MTKEAEQLIINSIMGRRKKNVCYYIASFQILSVQINLDQLENLKAFN